MSYYARAQLVQLEAERLAAEARTATSERLTAIGDELEVLVESLREIRREQLREEIDPPKRKRWWQR